MQKLQFYAPEELIEKLYKDKPVKASMSAYLCNLFCVYMEAIDENDAKPKKGRKTSSNN